MKGSFHRFIFALLGEREFSHDPLQAQFTWANLILNNASQPNAVESKDRKYSVHIMFILSMSLCFSSRAGQTLDERLDSFRDILWLCLWGSQLDKDSLLSLSIQLQGGLETSFANPRDYQILYPYCLYMTLQCCCCKPFEAFCNVALVLLCSQKPVEPC